MIKAEKIKAHMEKIQKSSHHIIKTIEYITPDTIIITPNDSKALESLLAKVYEDIPKYQEDSKYKLNPAYLKPNKEGKYIIQIIPENKCYPEAINSTNHFTLHFSHAVHNYVHRPH